MKRLFNNKSFLSLALILLTALTACKKEDVLTYNGPKVLHFAEPSYDFIVTPSDTGYDLKVATTTADAATVQIAIMDNSTAVEGVHFKQFSKTINIAAGQYVNSVKIVPIINNLDGNYVLNLAITNSNVKDNVKFNQTFTLNLSRFCPLDLSGWVGTFNCNEPGYGDYQVNFVKGTDPNTLVIDNFWDYGGVVTYTLNDAAGPDDATVEIKEQTVTMGGTDFIVLGTGTYEQCSRTMIVHYQVLRPSDRATYDDNTHTYTLP